MESKFSPVFRQEELVVQELINEVLIYDLKVDKAYCLNETSALVWKLCDGTRSVTEITRFIAGSVDYPVTEDLVWLALDQLKKENLLANGDEIASHFKGVSRRAVIRKVGLTSMITLPLISSLTAPTAASAQSSGCIQITDPCDPKGATPCCPHYSGPTACVDTSGTGTNFVCLVAEF